MSSAPVIGKYHLLERIGQGAMGEVFRAHDPVLDRQVALKELSVDQFSIYLQHDDKDHTLQAYGDKIMPAVAETVKAKA